ncbi:PAS domain-containing sensor histidine kinase [Clostridium sp.]|uniref:sensor histidine kinase n=1 Tax=Clostridium sp. TaxID=1506 RepID=UPI0026340D17|nr:PAS domain-containing sensor histidine kinase [Clostridium sp.]
MFIEIFDDFNLKGRNIRIIAIVSIILLSLFYIKCLNIFKGTNEGVFTGIDINCAIEEIIVLTIILLSLMVLSICFIYYRGLNKKCFFGISLVYISIVTEMITMVINKTTNAIQVYDLNLLSILFRVSLFFLSISSYKWFENLICKYKKTAIVFVVFITCILKNFNSQYFITDKNNIIFKTLIVLIMILYILIVIISFIKTFKNEELIYLVIMISVAMLLLKFIYSVSLIITGNYILKINIIFLFFISFIVFVFGTFFDYLQIMKNKQSMQEDLKAFFNLIEFDCNSEIILLSNKLKVIYANEKCRKNRLTNEKDNKYSELEMKIKEFLYNKNILNIESVLKNKNEWNGIIKLNYEDEVLNVNIQNLKKGNQIYYVLRINDITEKYKMEKQLKLDEQRLRGITENIKDLIITIDVDGKITYVNKAVKDVLGYDENELIGKEYFDFLLIESNAKFIDSNCFDKDKILTIDKVKSKESVVELESISSRIIDNKNRTLGWVKVARNIEDVKEIEFLKNKFEEIKQYDKVKSEFFANLSHELRTPINIIYSCIQLLNNNKKNEVGFSNFYEKYEKTLKQNCFRMLRLVNNLIDITKIDSGFMKMGFVNYDIIKLAEDITMSVIPYVESKNIDMLFDTDCEELEIKCDPDKIERIILNLLSNAIKFTESGGKIDVNIITNDKWVDIRIKDTGIGVPSHMKEFIFERFIQNDKSLNRNKEGSGIGLSLVKSLVELHNGKAFLRESSELGSEFSVLIPNIRLKENEEKRESLDYKTEFEKISIEFADIYEIY